MLSVPLTLHTDILLLPIAHSAHALPFDLDLAKVLQQTRHPFIVAGQRIQLKASLEGVSFAPAPDSAPSSSSSQGAPQEAVQAAQPGKIDKVSHMLVCPRPQHTYGLAFAHAQVNQVCRVQDRLLWKDKTLHIIMSWKAISLL